jgi:hypothetical protein
MSTAASPPDTRALPRNQLFAARNYDHDADRAQVRAHDIVPAIARRGTRHDTGLDIQETFLERACRLITHRQMSGFRYVPFRPLVLVDHCLFDGEAVGLVGETGKTPGLFDISFDEAGPRPTIGCAR